MCTKKAGKSIGPKISEKTNAELPASLKMSRPLPFKSRLNASAKHKRSIKIKDRYSGHVLFETETETLKTAVEEAVLSGVDLSCADLRNADLSGACLANVRLSNADFSGANLFRAILHGSRLTDARFYNVDLRFANIRYANLKKTVLQNADLFAANFLQSDLTQVDLRNANITCAELQGANLTGASIDARPMVPEKGSFVAWGEVYDRQGNPVIARLLIFEDAKRTTPLAGTQSRAEFVKVLELSPNVSVAKCRYYPGRIYRVGEITRQSFYNDDVQFRCPYGIYFFLTREEAEQDPGCPSSLTTAEYWASATYRAFQESLGVENELIATIAGKAESSTSFVRCSPINPVDRTLGFYLNDAGHAVVPANSVYPSTIQNHSLEYALSWEEGRVLQDFQVVYISKGKGIFQSTQGGLIPINAGDAFLFISWRMASLST